MVDVQAMQKANDRQPGGSFQDFGLILLSLNRSPFVTYKVREP